MDAINEKTKELQEALEKERSEKKLLLSAITSILIGINAKDQITYWNNISEGAFGVRSADIINLPFTECGIHWDYEAILKGLDECREKNIPVRINDVRFLRANLEEGYLGLTVIPVRGQELDILIFGADITERKKLEHMKDEFISTVSHELRTPLTVIREGVSQVLEGLLGEITENQKHFLSISLQSIDRLARIINDLLDISKIEASKLELRMDLVNLNVLVDELAAPSSPYQMRANSKGLVLKSRYSAPRVEVYAARDKIIQVFSNLIGNALKFTEKGHIEISLEDKGEFVECAVSDTGMGISKENLPKVFSKFQQFGRTHGPGEKGTGLGLAISKGLVEMHKGKIWIESELGKGTQFKFTLPKLPEKEILKQYVSSGIKKAALNKGSLTCIQFNVLNIQNVDETKKHLPVLMEQLDGSIKKSLRNKADTAVRAETRAYVILPSTNKQDADEVAKRIKADYERLESHPLMIDFKIVNYPEDGQTDDELLTLLLGEKNG